MKLFCAEFCCDLHIQPTSNMNKTPTFPSGLIPEYEEEDLSSNVSKTSPIKNLEQINPQNLKTPLEQILYNALIETQGKLDESEKINISLQGTLEQLNNRLSVLETPSQLKTVVDNRVYLSKNPKIVPQSTEMEYNTDEEELEKETAWIRVGKRNNKKRKMNSSLSPPQKLSFVNCPQKENPVPSSSNTNLITKSQSQNKIPPPPPIIVEDIKTFSQLQDILGKNSSSDYRVTIMSGNKFKINCVNGDMYRLVIKKLKENGIHGHTYENKQERSIKVMALKLHRTCIPEDIVNDLKIKGFKILAAVNKYSWKTKEKLDMFILEFQNTEDINKIYQINYILSFKVEIQPLRKNKLIPQCKNCQGYGHTQRFCFREARCVKCTGKHHTSQCSKDEKESPKCVHCGENHPASYRGCMVAKELQKLRSNQKKGPAVTRSVNKEIIVKPPLKNNYKELPLERGKNKISFANIVRGHSNLVSAELPDKESVINKTLQLILDTLEQQQINISKMHERLDRLDKLFPDNYLNGN